MAARTGAAITLDAPPSARLQGDAQALRSAIRKLLGTAVEYDGKRVELTSVEAVATAPHDERRRTGRAGRRAAD